MLLVAIHLFLLASLSLFMNMSRETDAFIEVRTNKDEEGDQTGIVNMRIGAKLLYGLRLPTVEAEVVVWHPVLLPYKNGQVVDP